MTDEPKFFERHNGRCDVCDTEAGIEVVAMPGVPASFAYCRECYAAGAHPYGMVVANTALIGGLEELATAAEWWTELVDRTLTYLNIPREQFNADVAQAVEEFSS